MCVTDVCPTHHAACSGSVAALCRCEGPLLGPHAHRLQQRPAIVHQHVCGDCHRQAPCGRAEGHLQRVHSLIGVLCFACSTAS